MHLKKEFSDLRLSFEPLTFYQKFEHICVLILSALIASTDAFHLLALAAAILALGAVYWLVGDRKRTHA